MAGTLKIVHEDSRGGPYIRVYIDDQFIAGRPLNPGDEITVDDVSTVAAMIGRHLGMDIVHENEQVFYDARGNRVVPG
jgi:hypothetical protein